MNITQMREFASAALSPIADGSQPQISGGNHSRTVVHNHYGDNYYGSYFSRSESRDCRDSDSSKKSDKEKRDRDLLIGVIFTAIATMVSVYFYGKYRASEQTLAETRRVENLSSQPDFYTNAGVEPDAEAAFKAMVKTKLKLDSELMGQVHWRLGLAALFTAGSVAIGVGAYNYNYDLAQYGKVVAGATALIGVTRECFQLGQGAKRDRTERKIHFHAQSFLDKTDPTYKKVWKRLIG